MPRLSVQSVLLASLLVHLITPGNWCVGQDVKANVTVTHAREAHGQFVIPDVSKKLSLASLLANRSVADELELNEQALEVLREFLSKNQGSFSQLTIVRHGGLPSAEELSADRAAREAHKWESERLLDEALAPKDWERLRQLAYQVEVHRIGLGGALVKGLLGRDVGVHEQQIELLDRRARSIEEEANSKIQKILAEAQEEMLAELTPEQQKQAKSLLGKPFVFRESL